DRVSLSNLNRQLLATTGTVGRYKTDAAAERVRAIAPDALVNLHRCFFGPESAGEFDFAAFDYVVDAIDTVTAKLELVARGAAAGTPIISCMGTGNKLDPSAFEVADITKTSICPLARVMRRELRRRGIPHLKVVYSQEEPAVPFPEAADEAPPEGRRALPGSISFVPAAAGLLLAGEVVRDLTGR
ncbi:MAG: ThiF family adenylyltransferase, partial [Oscillospiraceae bacterium]|nr:ThiF family adenylyltransferase [Oscillospiraceae bacterium]